MNGGLTVEPQPRVGEVRYHCLAKMRYLITPGGIQRLQQKWMKETYTVNGHEVEEVWRDVPCVTLDEARRIGGMEG